MIPQFFLSDLSVHRHKDCDFECAWVYAGHFYHGKWQFYLAKLHFVSVNVVSWKGGFMPRIQVEITMLCEIKTSQRKSWAWRCLTPKIENPSKKFEYGYWTAGKWISRSPKQDTIITTVSKKFRNFTLLLIVFMTSADLGRHCK